MSVQSTIGSTTALRLLLAGGVALASASVACGIAGCGDEAEDCIEYCAELYKPGVADATLFCAGAYLVQEGYDVFEHCEEPTNPAECNACVELVGTPPHICKEAIDECL